MLFCDLQQRLLVLLQLLPQLCLVLLNFLDEHKKDTKLYRDVYVPDTNGYEIKQYILNNYKNNIQGTIWEEIQNCEYQIYIPDKKQLKKYMIYTMLSSLASTMVVQSIYMRITMVKDRMIIIKNITNKINDII